MNSKTNRVFLVVFSLLLITGCGSGNSDAIRNSSYYESVGEVWAGLDASAKSTLCSFDDGEVDSAAYNLIKIGLKFDLEIDIDDNTEKWDEAIELFVGEKC